MTQYKHVCQTLGIELQCSSSPQFKPRVEHNYGTLQGRMDFNMEKPVIRKKYIPPYDSIWDSVKIFL